VLTVILVCSWHDEGEILHKWHKLTFTVNSKINSKIATGPRSHYLNLKNDESIDQSKNVDYIIND
jgi:hypothetical protein